MSFQLNQIPTDLESGREYALLGNYETAIVYYKSVCDGIRKQVRRMAITPRWDSLFTLGSHVHSCVFWQLDRADGASKTRWTEVIGAVLRSL